MISTLERPTRAVRSLPNDAPLQSKPWLLTLLKGKLTYLDRELELFVLQLDPRHGKVEFGLRLSPASPGSVRERVTTECRGHYVSTKHLGCVLVLPTGVDRSFQINDRYKIHVLQVSERSVRIVIDEIGQSVEALQAAKPVRGRRLTSLERITPRGRTLAETPTASSIAKADG